MIIYPQLWKINLRLNLSIKVFHGWKTSTKGVKSFNNLPKNAQEYIKGLEKFIETKVASISTSPERKDTILIENPF